MARCCIRGVNQAHADAIELPRLQIEISDRQTLAGAHPHMHFAVALVRVDPDRTAKRRELPTTSRRRMTEYKVIRSRPLQEKIDIEAHAVGADVVDRRIQHAARQGIHLDLAGAERMARRTGERHMQRALVEVVLHAGGVGIAQGYARHAGEDGSVLDLAHPLQVDAAGSQLSSIENGKDVAIAAWILRGHHRHLEWPITAAAQQPIRDSLGRQLRAEQHNPAVGRDRDLIAETAVEFAAQHLNGRRITRARVPGPRT